MSLISVDPFAWIDAIRRTTKIFETVNFLIALTFSGSASFLITCGLAMSYPLRRPTAEAIGEGMVMAAVMMTKTWRASPYSKGNTVALPEAEAVKEIQTDTQVITK